MNREAQADSPDRGRVLIVTGAGKGLGAAFAMGAGAAGARVLVNNRTRSGEPSSAERVAAAIREAGGEALAETSDVATDGAADAIIGAAVGGFGRLDGLILNAGVEGETGLFEKLAAPSFHDVMEINLHANVRLVAAAAPHLRKSPSPRIVFVSSAAGLYGAKGLAGYAASKGALNAFAMTLAEEFRRHGILVNVLCPFAETPMTVRSGVPTGDASLSPALVAPVAVWLASAACAATGEIWVASGGRFRRSRRVEGESFGPDDPSALTPEMVGAAGRAPRNPGAEREFSGAMECFNDLRADVAAKARAR